MATVSDGAHTNLSRGAHECVGLFLALAFLSFPTIWFSTGSARHNEVCKHRVYENIMMGNGPTKSGTHLGFTLYRTEDGTEVTAVFGYFNSAKGAADELQRETKVATKLISRSVETDKAGKAIGLRVEILVTATKTGGRKFEVAWTQGSYYHKVISQCREAALALEKRIKEGPIPVRRIVIQP